jgi:hypothetical protein
MIPDQSEAERQAAEKAAAEEQAAAKQAAAADASMNRLLRGQPSVEQEEQRKQIKEKTRKRLEEIAADDSDPENQKWAQDVLDGKTNIAGEPIKPKSKPASADGSAGRDAPPRTRSAADQFNASIRRAYRPWDVEPWWLA